MSLCSLRNLARTLFVMGVGALSWPLAVGAEPVAGAIAVNVDQAKLVKLPIATPETFTQSLPRAQWQKDPYFGRRAKRFPWQAGQPSEVYAEFANAIGIDPKERDPGELRAG